MFPAGTFSVPVFQGFIPAPSRWDHSEPNSVEAHIFNARGVRPCPPLQGSIDITVEISPSYPDKAPHIVIQQPSKPTLSIRSADLKVSLVREPIHCEIGPPKVLLCPIAGN